MMIFVTVTSIFISNKDKTIINHMKVKALLLEVTHFTIKNKLFFFSFRVCSPSLCDLEHCFSIVKLERTGGMNTGYVHINFESLAETKPKKKKKSLLLSCHI